jgi:uncharacterized protein (DUF697 family)/tellurite resistance protein
MTAEERDATLAICILAAYADGRKGDEERDELKRIAASLSPEASTDLAALHQEVLLGRRTLKDAASRLGPPELRQLAYEMAVCICDADGVHDEAEGRFLAELQRELGLEAARAEEVRRTSAALVTAPLAPPASPPAAAGPPPAPGEAAVDQAALDRIILDASILNGALELLPESLSTMAIIPLQMRLVYRVGKAHGYELDRGHVKDLLAAMGVGLTSQYVEQLGRQLVGGVLGALGGGLLRGLGRQAVSTGMAFASTYALGQVAKRYYAGGRKLDAQALRETFQSMLAEARSIGQARAPDIAARAQALDARQVVELVRGG